MRILVNPVVCGAHIGIQSASFSGGGMTRRAIGALMGLSVLAGSVSAEPPTSKGSACEIHLWPTNNISARTDDFGLPAGLIGGVDQDLHAKGDAKRLTTLNEILSPATQLDQLESLDLAAYLNVSQAKIVRHDVSSPSYAPVGTLNGNADNYPCSYNLIVRKISWSHKSIYHPILEVDFSLIGSGRRRDRKEFKSLSHFFPRGGGDTTGRDVELRESFKAEFVKFAQSIKGD